VSDSRYTMRRTGLSDDPNDYVFRADGMEVGRCYLRAMAGNAKFWHWTIYIGTHVRRVVEGVPIAGNANSLDEAKAQFRDSFERMIAAGVVKPPNL
jgi:hypothetical protein